MIDRSRWLADIAAALRRSRVTALLGPRRAGKTTLARQIVPPDSPDGWRRSGRSVLFPIA